jgi:hypothetical protein
METLIPEIVNWCIDRSEELNEEDSLALLREFEEWQQWEIGEIETLEYLAFPINF